MSPPFIRQREWVTEEDDYECNLSEEVQQLAKEELREDKNARDQALAQFRDWIMKNPDIENCRLDSNFLLRFLRVRKFSVPNAQQMLIRFLDFRRTFAHFTFNLDFEIPSVLELLERGLIFPLLEKDKNGRTVIMAICEKMDPYKFTSTDVAMAQVIAYETLLEDEDNQVLGFTHITDCKNITAAHITLWSPSEFAHTIRKGQKAIPMRHKELHYLHVPSALKYVYDWVTKRFSEKMRSRLMLHDTVETLCEIIDPKILPKEYGGDVPMADMIEEWKKTMKARKSSLLSMDGMDLSAHFYMNRQDECGKDKLGLGGIPGSFRSLEVD